MVKIQPTNWYGTQFDGFMVIHAHELKYFHHCKLSHEWKPDGDNPWVEIHETFLKEDPQSMNKICIKKNIDVYLGDMSC